jgi:hypothetical protein
MIGASFGREAQNWSAAWRMTSFNKVVFIVQLDGRMLRFLLQVKPYYHWHHLASILGESQLLWQVHLL